MIRNLVAALLAILTMLPFTAPCAAFDLAAHSSGTSATLDQGSRALPLLTASARTRTRLASEFDTHTAADYRLAPAVFVVPAIALAPSLSASASLSVLRI